MSRNYYFLMVAIIIASATAARSQEITPSYAPAENTPQAQPVVNSFIPAGTRISTTVSPDTPQAPGTSIAYVPQGTPLVTTPYTALGYAPQSAAKIIAGPLHNSMMARLADGTRIEIDSDNSAYKVYDDGSRVALAEGIHKMSDGIPLTIKNGKSIP